MNRSIHFGTTNIYHFIYACRYDQCEFMKYLVENGADILIHASLHGHVDVVKYLVDQGTDIHTRNDYALRLAREYDKYYIIK